MSITAVGVCDDLSSGKTCICGWNSEDETAGRIDVDLGVGDDQFGRKHRLDQVMTDIVPQR